jgi:hypothetical protein
MNFFEQGTQEAPSSGKERRSSGRFPIERDVRFRVLNKKNQDQAGAGSTVNMSSSGILFTTDQVLLPGRTVEVAVSWPAQLNNAIPLKLVARGRIVRFEPGRAAISIQHYEFRTQGSLGMGAPAE